MYRIMIVDDQSIVRQGIANIIDWEALQCIIVCYASDGQEALQQIPVYQPDIVFTDIVMPRMNGLELLRTINTTYPWIKTILISAYDEREYMHAALKNDAVDYLIKPFSREEVHAVVTRVIAKINDEQIRVPAGSEHASFHLIHAKERISDIGRLLSVRDTIDARKHAEALLKDMQTVSDGSRMMIVSMCLDLLLSAFQVLNTLVPGRRVSDDIGALSFLSRNKSIEDILVITGQVFNSIADKVDSDSSPVSILVQKARQLVEAHLSEGITIRRIADRLEVSTNYLQAIFRQETGLSMHQYIISTRVEQAKKLLVTTSKPVYEISSDVGYKDKDYFAKVFSSATGLTPQEYRKQLS
jgi:two-component system response regulator YesN